MQQAMSRQRMVSQNEDDEQVLAVPISIRGQPVGAIEVRLPPHQSQAEVRTIIQAVAERMAFSLENARLFDQARTAAEREQQLNQITARLQGLTSVEDVLATAISTLGQALGADRGLIRLVPLDAIVSPDTPPGDGPLATSGSNGHLTQDQHP
jgi:GAF domain-containing protein